MAWRRSRPSHLPGWPNELLPRPPDWDTLRAVARRARWPRDQFPAQPSGATLRSRVPRSNSAQIAAARRGPTPHIRSSTSKRQFCTTASTTRYPPTVGMLWVSGAARRSRRQSAGVCMSAAQMRLPKRLITAILDLGLRSERLAQCRLIIDPDPPLAAQIWQTSRPEPHG
jgi:hypothetical protein